jgi:radical SAM-linked protein
MNNRGDERTFRLFIVRLKEASMQDIRVWFEKRGRAKYISHLDLMRAMSRATRRAALPLWYTEGFNPHPYLSFPLPLPLGQEGLREAVDLRLTEGEGTREAGERLNAVLPEGLRVLELAQPWAGPGEIRAAEYEIVVPCGNPQAWAEEAGLLLAAGTLTAKKTGKQGRRKVEKEIALAPLILRHTLTAGEGAAHMRCTLAAGGEKNLNPALLAEALGGAQARITRLRLLRENGEEWV